MRSIEIQYLSFDQNGQQYLLAHMPFEILDNFSTVLIYDSRNPQKGGYQRKPEPKHYNKIRDYVIEHSDDYLLPTSVIIGLDKDDFEKIKADKSNLVLNTKTRKEIFRIIDGQHRIAGLREASKKDKNVLQFQLPVTIIITEPNNRSIELSIFNDINSKAKRIKVDLIKLAEYQYRLKEKKITPQSIVDHISIKVGNLLNEDEDCVWANAIKFDIHNEHILGLVGINAFMESIEPLVKHYLSVEKIDTKYSYSEVLSYSLKASDQIYHLLKDCWNNVVSKKWGSAFLNKKQVALDIDDELRVHFYKKDYYILKTLGVKVLNTIIADLYKEKSKGKTKANSILFQDVYKEFQRVIGLSKIRNDDWRMGNTFAGFSSESGFNTVKKMILNYD